MAMRMANIRMTTTVGRTHLLEILRANMREHSKIVQEARDGYIHKAKEALESRLESLRKGDTVNLTFHLAPPQDYTEVYRNSVEMLEMNMEEKIVLEADEFRQLVRDEWDWTDSFLGTNMAYSGTARRTMESKKGGR